MLTSLPPQLKHPICIPRCSEWGIKAGTHSSGCKIFICILFFAPVMICPNNLCRSTVNQKHSSHTILYVDHAILQSLFGILINQALCLLLNQPSTNWKHYQNEGFPVKTGHRKTFVCLCLVNKAIVIKIHFRIASQVWYSVHWSTEVYLSV